MAPKKPQLEDPPAPSSSEEEVESGEEEEEEVESGEEEEGQEEEEDDEEGESESDDQESAPKKPEPVSKPESASSSGEEEEGEEEEDEEEEDSDEEGSGKDESESDEVPKKSNSTEVVRSPAKPSVADEPKQKKTVSKLPSSTAPAIAVVPLSQKRPAESDKAENDLKKKKKKTDEENGGGSSSHPGSEKVIDPKKLFARVWSDDDEVVILKGMLVWHEKGDDPFADLGGFLDSIKGSVNATVNKDQLLNKMRRLKKKYQNNFKRGKGGLDPIFSKPHDLKCYELMKVIWGGEEVSSRKRNAPADTTSNGNDEFAATNGKKSRTFKTTKTTPVSPKQKTAALSDISSKELTKEVQNGMSAYPYMLEAFRDKKNPPILRESLLTEGLTLLGDSIAKDWEQRWKKINEAEAEVYLKRVDQVREMTAIILNAIKSSDS